MKNSSPADETRKYFFLILGSFAGVIVFGGLIFLLAGRLNYLQGWVLLAICFFILFVSIFSFRNRKGLVKERRTPGPGVKKWDDIIIGLYQVCLYSMIIVGILDAGRFRWSPPFPFWLYLLSGLLMIVFGALSLWALQTNDFFSSKVRIQSDRNHRVVSDGPYRFVRHPGYTGIIFMIFGLAIMLGSLWALIPGGIIAILFIIRTLLEDNILKKELPGYREYTHRVRFRLIPGIW
jgi:protein-S-isoprenylcysteine O-methyltransferase Ste14